MNSSRCSQKSLFQEQYQMNTSFIDNLRNQSSKIERLISELDSLKADNKRKQSQIIQLKRRQAELCRIIQLKDEQLAVEEENKYKIKFMKDQIDDLTEDKDRIQKQLEAKNNKNCFGMKNNAGWEKEKVILTQRVDELQKENSRIRELYENCKEENVVLRIQIESTLKNCRQIEKTMSKERKSINFELKDKENKIEKLEERLKKDKKQIQSLKTEVQRKQDSQVEQQDFFKTQLFTYENQLREAVQEISCLERKSFEWKNKYTELQLLVHKIEGMRKQWRVTKGELWTQSQIKEDSELTFRQTAI